jgi:hypothetical protein
MDTLTPEQRRAQTWPVIQGIGVALLAWGLLPINPYGYYLFLRVVVCGITAYLAFQAHETRKIGWCWTLGITAIIYNPVIRVHLTREVWSVLNVATIAILVATVWTLHRKAQTSA